MKSSHYQFHQPVLLKEAIDLLAVKAGHHYLDATAGSGGHTAKILELGGKVLAIDVDLEAISHLHNRFKDAIRRGQLKVARGNFAHLDDLAKEAGINGFAGVLFDLGLSSHQVDNPERGFSFVSEKLDMRADQSLEVTAQDLVNNLDRRRLYEIFKNFGQEKYAGRIADAIVSARQIKPITSAKELAEIIVKIKPRNRKRIHPATQAFQALRIVVNSELANLEVGLRKAVDLLDRGGRLVTIAYHSLEDGIIKDFLRKNPNLIILTRKPIRPTVAEIAQNVRSRSARMRGAEKWQ